MCRGRSFFLSRELEASLPKVGTIEDYHWYLVNVHSFVFFRQVLAFVATPRLLYKAMWTWIGPRFFPVMKSGYEFPGGGRVYTWLRLPKHFEGDRFYFDNSVMNQVKLPLLIDLPESQILEKDIGTHHLDLVLKMPESKAVFSRARRLVGRLSDRRKRAPDVSVLSKELVEARAETVMQKRHFEELFRKNPDGVVICEGAWFLYANPAFCQSLDLPEEKIDHYKWTDFLVGDRSQFDAAEEKTQLSVETLSGKPRLLEYIPGGSISYEGRNASFAITRDLSRINDLEKRLRNQQGLAVMGETAASIAHQVKTPLTLVTSKLQMALDALDNGKGADVRRPLHDAQVHASQISSIVDSLIGMVRRRSGLSNPAPADSIVDGVAALCSQRAKKLGVHLDVKCPGECSDTYPELEVTQILVNLTNNAIDAASATPGRRVEIRYEEEESQDHGASASRIFSVIDSGENIANTHGSETMEPFFTTKKEGTGLGLSVAQQLSELCGARLSLNEDSPSTRFDLSFQACAKV